MDVERCIRTIRGTAVGWLRFRVPEREKIACIEALAALGKKELDGVVLSAMLDGSPAVQAAAAGAITARFRTVERIHEVKERFGYVLLRATDPSFWLRHQAVDEAVALLCIASMNRNGHVRQAALVQMGLMPDPRYIPYVLYRLGDRVPQVREQAGATLGRHTGPAFRSALLDALPHIEALLRVRRVDLAPAHKALMAELVGAVAPERLVREAHRLGEPARSALVRFLWTDASADRTLVAAFLKDRHPLVRLLTVRHLATRKEEWSPDLLREAMHDAFGSIRKVAFNELIRRDRADPDLLREALTDPAFDIREGAAKRLGRDDEARSVHYRDRLQAGQRLVGSLLGLRDVKGVAAVDAIEPFTAHPRAAVRLSALRALAKLAPERAASLALAMVTDRSNAIRAKAERLLLARHDGITVERGRALQTADQERHRLAGLSLLKRLGGWAALDGILTACTDASPRIADQAWRDLEGWLRYAVRLFIRPGPVESERIRQALATLRNGPPTPTPERRVRLDQAASFLDGMP